ncbi:thioesterase [Rhodococcus sp. HNM0563]|uniref:thioesterase II family protein n=1 Tax=Rhodococcus sp. HNM0563 TaxID=2716339 RepID=UPI00146D7821|nr:alpha/beta fold hydrolase [Rhodococcus sp. HNM0563]NLU65616.1 thioesterase [Rhodococcus sp. HNM0563]
MAADSTTLVCIPFAGGGASFFAPWKRNAREDISLVPMQLPGRERRFAEPPVTCVADAVADLLDQLPSETAERLVIFGHSLGAVLAFELTRALERTGTAVDLVVVSGAPPPYEQRSETAAGLEDDDFVDRVVHLAGYEHPALGNPELRDMILPALRTDVSMHESYCAEPSSKVAAPITAVRGQADTLVSEDEVCGWARATRSSSFDVETLSGGHMYLTERFGEVIDLVARRFERESAR